MKLIKNLFNTLFKAKVKIQTDTFSKHMTTHGWAPMYLGIKENIFDNFNNELIQITINRCILNLIHYLML